MKKLLFVSMLAALMVAGCKKDDEAEMIVLPGASEIHYTTTDSEIILPSVASPFGEGIFIISNKYENGEGVIKLNKPTNIIATQAFSGVQRLTSVTVPAGITTIQSNAFNNCAALSNVSLPYTLSTIQKNAFSACASLESITIPSGVTSWAEAFSNNAYLKEVTLTYGLTTIGNAAFFNCTNLESIDIPDTVTNIDQGAFNGCTNLKNIYIRRTTPPYLNLNGKVNAARPLFLHFYNVHQDAKILVPSSAVSNYTNNWRWLEYTERTIKDPEGKKPTRTVNMIQGY